MQRGGTIWSCYPSDAPGPIDFDSPAGKPVWVKRFVWRRATDAPIPAGSVCHITDADENEVFYRIWPESVGDDVTEIELDVCSYFRGMKFEAFESGVLDLVMI